MGSKPKSPPPPDTVGAAKAEAAGNKEVAQITAGYNRPTQIDPYGQTTWSFGGGSQEASNIRQEMARLASLPGINGQTDPNVAAQYQNYAAQLERMRAAGVDVGRPTMGTPDNPRPGDWVQTTSLSPQQQAILNAEQGNDLALQQLASQGVGIARNVLNRPFNPQGLPQLGGVSALGSPQYAMPSANFGNVAIPGFQGSQLALPTYQGPQGAMPQFQGNTGQVAGITGPTGNMPQFGADAVGMAANRLNNMQRVNEDPNQFAAQRQQVSDALYNQLTRFSNERFAREEEAERTRLSNMGFIQGTAAYDNALREFRRSKDESYAGAANQAILAGGQEQSRLIGDLLASRQSNIGLGQAQFGQDQARYQQGLTERQAQFGAGMDTRNQQLQEQLARFQTGLQGRQQVQQEALDRFGAGMSGREQQLQEAVQRQQAMAQNYGLGLDERQTAFNANLARSGLAMDRLQAQLAADTNRYQLGLGERQAQQQSQMNIAQMNAQQRQQLFQEQAFMRSLPLNEVTALMSGSGVTMPQFAGFQPMQQWQGPQLLSAELGRYNAQLGATNAQNASRGQNLATVGALAGAAATFF